MTKYDIAIIGAGPGGYVAAIYAQTQGKKVLLIEKGAIGGVCLNRGCIPTKALISSLDTKLDFPSMMDRKKQVVNNLRSGVESLLKAKAVEIKRGSAKLVDKNIIEIENEKIESKAIIIATGSRPIELPSFKFDGKKILSSDHMLELKELPKKILIVGGGYIGCEFGYIYSSLGVEVTIVEMMDRLLPNMDRELSKNMELLLKRKKVKILTKTKADESLKDSFDKILVCVGRKPVTEGLGLDSLGIKTEKNFIVVNEFLKTNIDNIYAIGDVIGNYMLAHVASHEGIKACENIMGMNTPMDYSAVPGCVYTKPEIASVGLTKEEAESKGYKVKVAKFPFTASGKAQATGKTNGFVKMVADGEKDIILGVHIVGSDATNLIAEATLMVKFKMKVKDVADTIHAHPTLPEALMETCFSLSGKPIHTLQ